MLFNPEKFIEEAVGEAAKAIPSPAHAIIAASGGVDSTVAAALVHQAVGARLTCVFVDHGYLRKGEAQAVRGMLQRIGLPLVFVDASREFYDALRGVTDPEQKRKIIGEKFIRVFEREARKVSAEHLVQGTIAPDWIESGGGVRDTIKSHHNVGGLPKDMRLKVVEPLRDLYKDEVRKVARALQLEVAERQPFPGPGLAVRILGEASEDKVRIVQEACAIVEEEVESAVKRGLIQQPWQYFAALLPVRSVGVQGDIRAYGFTVVVRVVDAVDAMTASATRIPHEVLARISRRITNTLKDQVNRVVFDITDKPPGTVEWE